MSDNNSHQAVLGSVRSWISTGAEQVDDIATWRENPGERIWHGGWPDLPDMFFTRTSYLCGWIRCHLNEDPSVLVDVHEAVTAWNDDHNASRLPDQGILAAKLERAVMLLQSVQMVVLRGQKRGAGRGKEVDAATLVRDDIRRLRGKGTPIKQITRDDVAHRTGLSGGAVSSTKAWKALALEKKQARLPQTAEEAALAAAEQGDWEKLKRLQAEEERRQRQGNR